jgi:hypothetical protein
MYIRFFYLIFTEETAIVAGFPGGRALRCLTCCPLKVVFGSFAKILNYSLVGIFFKCRLGCAKKQLDEDRITASRCGLVPSDLVSIVTPGCLEMFR